MKCRVDKKDAWHIHVKKKTKSKVIVKKHDTYMYNGIPVISRVNDSYMAHVENLLVSLSADFYSCNLQQHI